MLAFLKEAASLEVIIILPVQPEPGLPRIHNILIHQFGVSGPVINWMLCQPACEKTEFEACHHIYSL